MESWPGTLPQRVLNNFEIEPRCGLVDDGEVRNPERNRTYPERDATFQVFMTLAQLEIFKTFWNVTLNQAAPFTAPWLEPLGYSFHFLRFRDVPKWVNAGGGYWSVSLPVEIIAGVESDGSGNPAIFVSEVS